MESRVGTRPRVTVARVVPGWLDGGQRRADMEPSSYVKGPFHGTEVEFHVF